MNTYKHIKRRYYDTPSPFEHFKIGTFVARGKLPNGQFVYALLDQDGNVIENCCYLQLRGKIIDKRCLYMQRV